MVHNGIEYGIMAAYAEGLSVLRDANIGKRQQAIDAETTPLRDPEDYQYDFHLGAIAEVWRRGSVIASWLLDLTAAALLKDPALSKFAGRVSDSGEGRWTIKAAIDEGVPVPVLTTALYERFNSRGDADFQDKLLSAMRFEFRGHLEFGMLLHPEGVERVQPGVSTVSTPETPSHGGAPCLFTRMAVNLRWIRDF
jgi:6-phosphogluconate dehydrogenase